MQTLKILSYLPHESVMWCSYTGNHFEEQVLAISKTG